MHYFEHSFTFILYLLSHVSPDSTMHATPTQELQRGLRPGSKVIETDGPLEPLTYLPDVWVPV